MKNKLSKSTRKFIRQEKARIRRDGLAMEEKNKKITELYQRFAKKVVATPVGEKNDKKNQRAT